jgi:enoyl-CoA hydratase/carnithine racemase
MGNKAFCAGGDIRGELTMKHCTLIVHAKLTHVCFKAIYDSKKTGGPLGSDFFREEYVLNHLIGTLHTNHIALLDGITSTNST